VDSPFFSVVIPTYNRETTIKNAVLSVLAQTFSSFEMIIVDDGSTDTTSSIILDLAQADSRIRYLHQHNQERGAARNSGISLATGKWISFLDSDEIFLPRHLESLYAGIASGISEGVIASRYLINENGDLKKNDVFKIPSGPIRLSSLLVGNPFACNFAALNIPEKLSLFQEDRSLSSMEDWIFLLENISTLGLYLLPEATVVMNDHSGRSMRAHDTVVKSRLKAVQLINRRLSLDHASKRDILLYSYYFCSVHAYMAGNQLLSFRFLLLSIPSRLPYPLKLKQLCKTVVGFRFISLLKQFLPAVVPGLRVGRCS